MGDAERRLMQTGHVLPRPATPVGSYLPAMRSGNLVYVSGQLPSRDGQLLYKGRVGKDLDMEAARSAAEICFVNCLAALTTLGIELDAVVRVVKLVGHVQSAEGFFDQPKVMNAASDLSEKVFGERGRHARAALGAFALPLDAAVELEAIFEVAF